MNLLNVFKKALEKEFCLISILIMIGMAAFLPNLFRHDLWEPDELRCAEVAREVLVDGHWIVPHLEGEVYPDKPPLYFWLVTLFSYCFGGLNTFSIRLPSALAGIGGILITFFFGKQLGNKWTGLIASLILAAMPCYFTMSITARMDILLTFFVSSAFYCFYLAYSGNSSWFYLLFYFLMGMGTLTKGPIGFFIPFLTVLSYLLGRREWKNILQLRLLSGFLIFAGTVASWVVPAIIIGGRDYAYQILFHQNVDRYIGGWNHQNPFTYYFKVLPIILMPWTPLLPAVFVLWFSEWRMRNNSAHQGGRPQASSFRTPQSAFPIMWLITTFVFLSCSGSRGRIYLLPVLPAVALAMASTLNTLFDSLLIARRSLLESRVTKISYFVIPCLFIAGAVSTPLIIKHNRPSLFTLSLPILGILGVGSVVCVILTIYKVYKASFIAFVATVLITSFTFSFQVLPVISQDRSVRMLFAEISRFTKEKDDLCTYLIPETVGYSYYWGDVLKRISTEEELRRFLEGNSRAFCLMKERHYRNIMQDPDSPISVVLKMRASGIRFVLVTAGAPNAE
ncbi:MAG TPA: ArnT family glycosyltransferase [Candidatus Brocadiia bacterium]|nr:glycosyltransferase family 39 protein [Planctomycetota bacterium]MDO8092601.1 glycosyltransferase family 39 protein [Candidatus Brocadiales bacterium]